LQARSGVFAVYNFVGYRGAISVGTLFVRSHRGGNVRSAYRSILSVVLLISVTLGAADTSSVDKDGTRHLPAFALPESSLLDSATRAELQKARDRLHARERAPKPCPSLDNADKVKIPAIRACLAESYYETPGYKHLRDLYKVKITSRKIGGVLTENFVPQAGIAEQNRRRVLINVHGGGFQDGARTSSHPESAPIAAIGRIEVISIDYRLGPEFAFPAASEDVAAVYREVLKSYKPKNIGIYGCSAGGLLTAQAIAWFQKEHLPMPGAIGMFCGAASFWFEGDSGVFFSDGHSPPSVQSFAYFRAVAPTDPLAFPMESPEIMAKFPPSLLISSTRDLALSSVVNTHAFLVAHGVPADLHVWEGLGHGFFLNPDLPQSREAYAVIVGFFDARLGR
jgi:epsilon-lactone hydrolase